MDIKKFMMPEVIFGEGAIEQVGDSCLRLGARKVLIVSDPGVVDAGWVDIVIKSCQSVGLAYHTFIDVTENPKDYEVEQGCRIYKANECDSVIGVGGGSAIDVAKAIAILATNEGTIHDFEGVNKIKHPLPPQVMVTSTAGSGSEVSQFSVISDSVKKKKMTIIAKSLIPDIAIIDPNVLTTKSVQLIVASGMDVLAHGIESFVSLAATPLTDVHARNAISLVSKYLQPSVALTINKEANSMMAMASLQAGLAFSNAILGAVHAMSHAIGGRRSMLHGDVNSILLPYVMEFNLIAKPERFAEIAQLLGENIDGLSNIEAGQKAISHVRRLSKSVNAPQKLSDLGVKEMDFSDVSKTAFVDACMITNPRDITIKEIEHIFQSAR